MGRGPRQDGALNFSSPLRRQKLREPKEWGESYYRFRYIDTKGNVHDSHGAARDRVIEPFIWIAKGRSGSYEIIHSTALRDGDGNLSWHERKVDSVETDETSYNLVERVVNYLNEKPQGHALEESVDGSQIILKHVYNQENSYSSGGDISFRKPIINSVVNHTAIDKDAGEEAIGKAYAQMQAEVDQANLANLELLQERRLERITEEIEEEQSRAILDKVKSDYQEVAENVKAKQEAFERYLDEKEEVEEKLDDKTRAKRAQSTIDALRRS